MKNPKMSGSPNGEIRIWPKKHDSYLLDLGVDQQLLWGLVLARESPYRQSFPLSPVYPHSLPGVSMYSVGFNWRRKCCTTSFYSKPTKSYWANNRFVPHCPMEDSLRHAQKIDLFSLYLLQGGFHGHFVRRQKGMAILPHKMDLTNIISLLLFWLSC